MEFSLHTLQIFEWKSVDVTSGWHIWSKYSVEDIVSMEIEFILCTNLWTFLTCNIFDFKLFIVLVRWALWSLSVVSSSSISSRLLSKYSGFKLEVISQGAPLSSTNKTEHHDMAKILLKVALNTYNTIIS